MKRYPVKENHVGSVVSEIKQTDKHPVTLLQGSWREGLCSLSSFRESSISLKKVFFYEKCINSASHQVLITQNCLFQTRISNYIKAKPKYDSQIKYPLISKNKNIT